MGDSKGSPKASVPYFPLVAPHAKEWFEARQHAPQRRH